MFLVKQKINVLDLFTPLQKINFSTHNISSKKKKEKKKVNHAPYYLKSEWKFTDLHLYFTRLYLEWDFD